MSKPRYSAKPKRIGVLKHNSLFDEGPTTPKRQEDPEKRAVAEAVLRFHARIEQEEDGE